MLCALPSTNQTCRATNQYWLLTGQNFAGVTPYTGITSIAAKRICLEPVKRATKVLLQIVELPPMI